MRGKQKERKTHIHTHSERECRREGERGMFFE